jgi:hypothetical protein
MYQQYIADSLFTFADNKRLTISYTDYKNRVFAHAVSDDKNADQIVADIMARHGLRFAGEEVAE